MGRRGSPSAPFFTLRGFQSTSPSLARTERFDWRPRKTQSPNITGNNNNRRPVAESLKTPACNTRGGVMGSRSIYPRTFYDNATLASVESVLGEVWDALANNALRSEHAALRVAIINQLLDLVDKGVNSHNELRARTLRHFEAGTS
jgi:hypothetical protein